MPFGMPVDVVCGSVLLSLVVLAFVRNASHQYIFATTSEQRRQDIPQLRHRARTRSIAHLATLASFAEPTGRIRPKTVVQRSK